MTSFLAQYMWKLRPVVWRLIITAEEGCVLRNMVTAALNPVDDFWSHFSGKATLSFRMYRPTLVMYDITPATLFTSVTFV